MLNNILVSEKNTFLNVYQFIASLFQLQYISKDHFLKINIFSQFWSIHLHFASFSYTQNDTALFISVFWRLLQRNVLIHNLLNYIEHIYLFILQKTECDVKKELKKEKKWKCYIKCLQITAYFMNKFLILIFK